MKLETVSADYLNKNTELTTADDYLFCLSKCKHKHWSAYFLKT